jgi:hypothetical protein
MPSEYTYEVVLMRIEAAIHEAGGVRGLAREWGASPSYISEVRLGRKEASTWILEKLGLETVTYYVQRTTMSDYKCKQCRRVREACRCNKPTTKPNSGERREGE